MDEVGYQKRLGALIRAARTRAGLTITAVERASGIGRSYLCQIESGRRGTTVYTLRRVAAAIGTTAAELLAAAEPDPG